MCGIAGFVGAGGADPAALTWMCDALAHRGPDDQGARVWADHGVGLGHRRLSIIDLSPTGRNPMSNEDETVWVVHNGEIYNYRELRRELEREGHVFRSSSDTEVIVHAYEQWGDDHLQRLRGMFAYAVYDRRGHKPRLVLVRDRIGIKPLHFAWDGGRLAFGSEPKALLALPWVDRRPDLSALADYLTYLCVPAPKSAFAGIRKLRPGESLIFEDDRIRLDTWWDVRPTLVHGNGARDDAAERVEALLHDAVAAHMVADVPVGLFLSGGVDSSSVAALMTEATDRAVPAYSIGFDVPEHTEVHHAASVADRFGLDHHARTVGVDAVRDALDRVGRMHDEPFADGSAVPTLHVAELAAADVKVVLTGDGGDEVFAGYRWYFTWLRESRFDLIPAPVRRLVVGALATVPRMNRFASLPDLAVDPFLRYARLMELFTPEGKRDVLAPTLVADLDGYDHYGHLRRWWREDLDPITRVQYLDLKTYLPDDILTKVDRATMSVSLEARPPLLDHELVEAVFALPAPDRVPARDPKGLLKRAMRDRLPAEVLERPKKGFSAPWNAWLPEMRMWAMNELRDGAAVQAGILTPDPISAVSGPRREGARVWSLLVLERWCRAHL